MARPGHDHSVMGFFKWAAACVLAHLMGTFANEMSSQVRMAAPSESLGLTQSCPGEVLSLCDSSRQAAIKAMHAQVSTSASWSTSC